MSKLRGALRACIPSVDDGVNVDIAAARRAVRVVVLTGADVSALLLVLESAVSHVVSPCVQVCSN